MCAACQQAKNISPGWYALHVGRESAPPHPKAATILRSLKVTTELPHSAVVGAVRIDGSYPPEECNQEFFGRWAFGPRVSLIGARITLPKSVVMPGKQGVWKLPSTDLEKIRRRLARTPVQITPIAPFAPLLKRGEGLAARRARTHAHRPAYAESDSSDEGVRQQLVSKSATQSKSGGNKPDSSDGEVEGKQQAPKPARQSKSGANKSDSADESEPVQRVAKPTKSRGKKKSIVHEMDDMDELDCSASEEGPPRTRAKDSKEHEEKMKLAEKKKYEARLRAEQDELAKDKAEGSGSEGSEGYDAPSVRRSESASSAQVGHFVRFQKSRKHLQGTITKLSETHATVALTTGEKLKVLAFGKGAVPLHVVESPPPLWYQGRGHEDGLIFKEAVSIESPASWVVDKGVMMTVATSTDGLLPPATKENPTPKWAQMLSANYYTTPGHMGSGLPICGSLVTTEKKMQASDEMAPSKRFLCLSQAHLYDTRTGKASKDTIRLIGAMPKAIKGYRDRPDRVSWVDPTTDLEWDQQSPFPLVVVNVDRKDIEAARGDCAGIRHRDAAVDELRKIFGPDAWNQMLKGVAVHPLFNGFLHVAGALGFGNIFELMYAMAHEPSSIFRKMAPSNASMYFNAICNSACTSISVPISRRYPVANGIDKKTQMAALHEYHGKAGNLLELLLDNKKLGMHLPKCITDDTEKFRLVATSATGKCLPVLPSINARRVQDRRVQDRRPPASSKAPATSGTSIAYDKDDDDDDSGSAKEDASAKSRARKSALGIKGSPFKNTNKHDSSDGGSRRMRPRSLAEEGNHEALSKALNELPGMLDGLQKASERFAVGEGSRVAELVVMVATKEKELEMLRTKLEDAEKARQGMMAKHEAALEKVNVGYRECATREAKLFGQVEVLKAEKDNAEQRALQSNKLYVDLVAEHRRHKKKSNEEQTTMDVRGIAAMLRDTLERRRLEPSPTSSESDSRMPMKKPSRSGGR